MTEDNRKKPWQDEYVLKTLYCDQELTIREVADTLGCSRHPVHSNLKEYNIGDRVQRRANRSENPVNCRVDRNGYVMWTTTEEHKHVTFGVHRLLAISEFGTEVVAENDVHHENGIPWDNRPDNLDVLSKAEHRQQHKKYDWVERLAWHEFYRNGDVSHRELASALNVPHGTIATELAK